MRKVMLDKLFIAGSIIGFFLMSVSFVLMPVQRLQILPGVIFWCGLALGIAFQIVLMTRYRKGLAKGDIKDVKMRRPGIATFGANLPAKIVDCLLPVSIAAMLLTILLTKGYGFLCYVFIATTWFTFCLHCILNGKIFFHIKRFTKVPEGSGRKGKYAR